MQSRASPGKQMGPAESGQGDVLNKSGLTSALGRWWGEHVCQAWKGNHCAQALLLAGII